MGARSGWHIPPGNKALVGLNFLCKQQVKPSAGVYVPRGNARHVIGPLSFPRGTQNNVSCAAPGEMTVIFGPEKDPNEVMLRR